MTERFDAPARRHLHLVGIGGIGMSGLARLLIQAGHTVSGSDLAESSSLQSLRALGARITVGHSAAAVLGADTVIASPAVPWRNIELDAARLAGVPVVARAEALSALLEGRQSICVSGSHGKTTTTAMLTLILQAAGKPPGFLVGGITPALGGISADLGHEQLFVLEACEAFRALNNWQPEHCVVTNIDDEHSDHYGGHDRLRAAFTAMLGRIPATGTIAVCGDDYGALTLAENLPRHLLTYGLGQANLLRADQIRDMPEASEFRVLRDGIPLGTIHLSVPGSHNVRNALAALAIALELGVPFGTSATALHAFTGVGQRWESMGQAHGVRAFHDCAHHPTEIEATLTVARASLARNGKLLLVLRPQLHSRVGRLAEAFAEALALADRVLLLPVDGAGEVAAGAQSDTRLVEALEAVGVPFQSLPDAEAVARAAVAHLRDGDILVTMGPGDLGAVARRVLDTLHAPLPTVACLEATASGAPALLQGFFERRTALSPDMPCIEEGDLVWTYREIEAHANQVARYLTKLGAGPDSLVVLHVEKSMRMLALLLGVLKAGAAYLPIDPHLERDTLHGQVDQQQGLRCIISDGHWRGDQRLLRRLDAIWPEICWEDTAPSPCPAGPTHLAYAMFTSGSTGTPKLVGVEHRNIASLVTYATSELLDAEDLRAVPFIDSISFDSSVHQIFTTLTHGGALLVTHDLIGLLQSPQRNRITSVGTTPAVLRRILDAAHLPASVRVIGLGGDVIPEALIDDILKLGSVRKALNYYGPTETTIYSTVAWLIDVRVQGTATRSSGPSGRILGNPVSGTQIYILDEAGLTTPAGQYGEIYIAGAGVARGYLGAPALTAERFGRDTFDPDPGARWYRTGDRGRRLPDGRIEFGGRTDNQFKLQGVRLEAEEIEFLIASCPGVRAAAVALREAETRKPLLAAFVVAEAGFGLERLRDFMFPKVPALMIPTRLALITELPITPGGKLDRKALAYIELPAPTLQRDVLPPRNAVEAQLLDIWKDVLHRDHIGIDDDFFEVGGDSLASMRILVMIESAFGVVLDARIFNGLGSIATLAQQLLRAQKRAPTEPLVRSERTSILRKQWMHVAGWVGRRHTPDSLIVTLNPEGQLAGLFWCLQGYEELTALGAVLGELRPVHGMRSGHLVMRYSPESLDALASQYAKEIMQLQPTGSIRIGGNCQGGTVARVVALKLLEHGRQIEVLFLMEISKFRPFGGRVVLIFGRDSVFNPQRRTEDLGTVFQNAYPVGFEVDLITGAHGAFFREPNILSLGAVLNKHLA